MEVIFQSGEFFIEGSSSLLESILGALIGTGTALGVFLLENWRQKNNEREKRESDLKDFLFYFKELYTGIIQTLEKQIQAYEKNAKNFKEEPFKFHLLEQSINQDLERVSEKLDLERLFHAYILVNGNSDEVKKEYKNLISILDHTFLVHGQAWESQRIHHEKLEAKLRQYKELVEESTLIQASLILNKIVVENPDRYTELPLYAAINTVVQDYNADQDEPPTLEYMQKTFVEPLRDALFPNFRHLNEAIYLVDNCRKATWLYHEIESRSIMTSKEFKSYAESFKHNHEKLKKIKGCA